jgi:hypothetical protein
VPDLPKMIWGPKTIWQNLQKYLGAQTILAHNSFRVYTVIILCNYSIRNN